MQVVVKALAGLAPVYWRHDDPPAPAAHFLFIAGHLSGLRAMAGTAGVLILCAALFAECFALPGVCVHCAAGCGYLWSMSCECPTAVDRTLCGSR